MEFKLPSRVISFFKKRVIGYWYLITVYHHGCLALRYSFCIWLIFTIPGDLWCCFFFSFFFTFPLSILKSGFFYILFRFSLALFILTKKKNKKSALFVVLFSIRIPNSDTLFKESLNFDILLTLLIHLKQLWSCLPSYHVPYH